MLRSYLRLLPLALALATVAALVVGAVRGWSDVTAGYPLLAVDAVRATLDAALLATAGFLLVYVLLHRWLAARLSTVAAVAVAAAVAGAPLVALGGFYLNLARGLRPADLATAYGLKVNLGYLALCAVLYLLVCLGLHRHAARAETPPAARPRLGLAAAVAVVLLAVHGTVFAGFAGGGEKSRPDVIVILVDALRADHLSAYGYHRPTTPAIDSLAADGVLFRHAISQSTFTKTSIASLFTGRNPYQHGVYWGSFRENPESITSDVLAAGETTLAEGMRDAGYLTAAWVQNSHLRDFMGFGQGFVAYHDQQGSQERIHRRFFPWLEGPGRRYPFFAYLHYIDLHDPYRPEPPYDTLYGSYGDVYDGVDFAEWGAYLQAVRKGEVTLSDADVRQLRAYYDGLIRQVDEGIGRLLDKLRAEGLYDDSLIVLTSDHGDAFMEHGFISHSTTPYDELLRVPLIVKMPGGRFAGREVTAQVRLVDVLPTVLEEVGAETPPEVAGCPLQPLLDPSLDPGGAERDPRCAVAVSEIAEEEGVAPIVAVRTDGWKLIDFEDRPDELYDLRRDPGERNDLLGDGAGGNAAEVGELAELRAVAGLVAAERARLAEAEKIELDERQIRDLKALGYLE